MQRANKAEDAIDARPNSGAYSTKSSGDSSPDDSGIASGFTSLVLSDDDLLTYYKADHRKRGRAVVICNTQFAPSLKLPQRKGVEQDIQKIKDTFCKQLGFELVHYAELTASQMYRVMTQESQADHKDSDCLAVFVLTHGSDNGILYGTDTAIAVSKFVEPLKTSKSLLGKPKLLFIQSCRGAQWDHGMEKKVVADAGAGDDSDPTITLPVEADFLYAYSTAEGYVSFNNPKNGSWFIQALCAEFAQNSDRLEVMQMLTRVCNKIAYEYASHTPSKPETHNLKQVSSITTTLTKSLKLPSK